MLLFNVARFYAEGMDTFYDSLAQFVCDKNVSMGIILVPVGWILLYYLTGYYLYPLKNSPVKSLINTLASSLIGVTIVFFVIVINDYTHGPNTFYALLIIHFLLHGTLTFLFRQLAFRRTITVCLNNNQCLNALIIGCGFEADILLKKRETDLSVLPYRWLGAILTPVCSRLANEKKIVGTIDEIGKIIEKYRPDELVVALNRNAKQENKEEVLKKLYPHFLPIKIVGSDFTPSFGYIQMNNLMTRPFTELPPQFVPSEYLIIKKIADQFFALLLLILLAPLFGWIAAMIWRKEGVPILYKQTRIGHKGKSFTLYKFRTMVPDAEKDLPLLSGKEDNRITRTGSFLRKHRLDELPQLFNVLRGEMSFIGPRPEREYYIQTIVENHPEYYLLQRVKPGITSLGMVKYGYADSVEKMIKRSTYDLIYLRNINPVMDLRIIFYTLKTIIVGKGI